MMYNVVVTVSCTVCVPAESSREAIDAVNKGITNDDLDIGLQVGSAIQYAIRNGHIEATKAIEVED